MLNNLKALVVVLALAYAVFRLARPLCLQFMSSEAFARRRNVWFALTLVAFLSPIFWIYAIFSAVLLWWAASRDENPLALYVLVSFAIPDVRFYIPTVLINQLFDLTQYRILSLVILMPWILSRSNQPIGPAYGSFKYTDMLLLAFLSLQLLLQIPYQSATTTMRNGFLLTLDIFVVFYAFSRVATREKLSEVLACFWLACAIMAIVAIFEWVKGWLLYEGLGIQWGDRNEFAFIMRGNSLRAQAAAQHSINLGYVLAVSLGFFLYLRGRAKNMALSWAVIGLFCVALYATGSRGAWITAFIAVISFVSFRPGVKLRLAGALAIGIVLISILYFSPLKETVIDRLPLIGTQEQGSIDYRQQLFELSWLLIQQNPFFGDPFVAQHMESLRQGQGIIDIVNGYLFTALFNGLVGLFLQVSLFLAALWVGGSTLLRMRRNDVDSAELGAALVAAFLASLFYIATAGYGTTTYILAGLLVSYGNAMSRLPLTLPVHLPPSLHARSAAHVIL